jgi:hypothetical protein
MSKRQPNAITAVIAELEQECAPELERFLNERGDFGPDDETLAKVAERFISANPLARQYAGSAMAMLVAHRYVQRTDRDDISCKQLAMFSREEARGFAEHATHRTGEGTTILQKHMTREQVIARHARKQKNGDAVNAALIESERFTTGILRYMDEGLEYADAFLALRDELAGDQS